MQVYKYIRVSMGFIYNYGVEGIINIADISDFIKAETSTNVNSMLPFFYACFILFVL